MTPHPHIKSSYGLSVDRAQQSRRPGERQGEKELARLEDLQGPYLSIRTSSWAPGNIETEKLVTKERLP